MIALAACVAASVALLSGCKSSKNAPVAQTSQSSQAETVPVQLAPYDGPGVGPALAPGYRFIPKAVAYKTSGDYRDNVPVNLGPNGEIVSYPAPSDIDPAQLPVRLGHGWLLDRRGVGERTAFTRYTYAQYAALPQAPTPRQLREAIIPGARVTALATLPLTLPQALADPSKASALLPKLE